MSERSSKLNSVTTNSHYNQSHTVSFPPTSEAISRLSTSEGRPDLRALKCAPSSESTVPNSCTAISDTGTSGCFLAPLAPCTNVNQDTDPISVNITGRQPHTSSAACKLLLRQVPVRTVHIMPQFHQNLLGIRPLCDAGCRVLFKSGKVTVFSSELKAILTKWCDPRTPRLWRVDLRPSNTINRLTVRSQWRHLPFCDIFKYRHFKGTTRTAKKFSLRISNGSVGI